MRRMGIFFVVAAVFLACGCTPRIQYSIISENSGKCMSLNPTGGYYDGDPAEQWDCSQYHMGLQASWQFVPSGQSNTYHVISIHSGKCLEVKLSSGGKNNGDIVQQSKCTWGDNQKWIVITGQTSTTITSLYSGKCVEVKLGSTGGLKDGDIIDQWDCTGAKNQIWMLQPITAPKPPLDTGKGELCNACNPANPECKPGALCLIMPSGQSVCGQSCSTAVGCPTGYTCTKVTKLGQTYFQCVPTNNECVAY
jgi:hypothetical protein